MKKYHLLNFFRSVMKHTLLPLFQVACIAAWAAASLAQAGELQYRFPVQPENGATFAQGGHSYPGIDIFAKPGSVFLAPVSGVIEDIQANDQWHKEVNDPGQKGGKWVSLIGDDGFRYYGSHLAGVADQISVGQHMQAGDVLGTVGNSGNAHATPPHLHFGISSAQAPYNWKTRRGEIEPHPFLRCLQKRGCDPRLLLGQ